MESPRSNLQQLEQAQRDNPLYGVMPGRVTYISEDGHWLWQGTVKADGYGVMTVYVEGDDGTLRKTSTTAHRRLYELWVGPLGVGEELDHLCGVKRCVRPDHLDVVSHLENTLRYHRARTGCQRGHEYAECGYTPITRAGRQIRRCNGCYAAYLQAAAERRVQ